jgi:DNA primase
MIYELVKFLETFLGSSIPKSKGNYAYRCPVCKHSKHKLEIQPETQNWHCWVCGVKGTKLHTLLKRINATSAQYDTLNKLIPSNRKVLTHVETKNSNYCTLPKEYIPLYDTKNSGFMFNTCIDYLYKRGITSSDILKYKIGYCLSGKYANMMIFPNYNHQGILDYFTTRTFLNSNKNKFVNPPFSRNVVGFELQLNWNLPIVLVESALDAITVKINASPLYGTDILSNLKIKILENNVKKIYIALDSDAIKKSINVAQYFITQGIDVHLVELPLNTDPNSLGFDKMWQLINNSEPISESTLFNYRIINCI